MPQGQVIAPKNVTKRNNFVGQQQSPRQMSTNRKDGGHMSQRSGKNRAPDGSKRQARQPELLKYQQPAEGHLVALKDDNDRLSEEQLHATPNDGDIDDDSDPVEDLI